MKPYRKLVDGKAYYYTTYPFGYKQDGGGVNTSVVPLVGIILLLALSILGIVLVYRRIKKKPVKKL